MSEFIVDTRRISKIRSHNNADRLQLAEVGGLSYQFIIPKDSYKVGDVVVYFPIDSLLPDDLAEKLGVKKYLKSGNRVKTVKLRGEISQGIVERASKLGVTDFVGQDLTTHFGVKKYEPSMSIEKECPKDLIPLPDGLKIYDIESADRYSSVLNEFPKCGIFEKLEGTNASVTLCEKGWFVNQRRYSIKRPSRLKNFIRRLFGKPVITNKYWEAAKGIFPFVQFVKNTIRCKHVTVYFELLGPGIQGNYYNLEKHEPYIIDVKVDDKFLTYKIVLDFLQYFPYTKHAPLLWEGATSQIADIRAYSNGVSVLNSDKLREGIVIRSSVEKYSSRLGGRLILKQRSPEYLAETEN